MTPAREVLARAEREVRNHSLEAQFALQLEVAHLHRGCFREYRFDAVRRWRLDFAWPDQSIAVELHGGTFAHGAHSRGAHQRRDFEKANALVLAGWRLLVFDTTMIRDGTALQATERLLHQGERG